MPKRKRSSLRASEVGGMMAVSSAGQVAADVERMALGGSGAPAYMSGSY